MNVPEILLERLAEADHVVVLTGAGVSAESGIKTFRDPDGLWAKFNPAELASVDGFMSNPDMVWNWYQHRREIINSTKPNPGHFAIAKMQELFPKFTLITQNVDRLHQKAGSKEVFELHGNIIENHCFKCQQPFDDEIDYESKSPPKCKLCGGLIRPSVVWFGEMLPF
jgi:NAD-dependent deacetylase